MGTAGLDLIILENIGNLLCPADTDTGASKNAMILSVPEGDDKPLKYPHMFEVADVLLVNKIDTVSFFNFDFNALRERVTRLNPDIKILPISAKTGEGIPAWAEWLRTEVNRWKSE
jgi:hydrogenase nickel incorporation protein HypB